MNIYVVYFLVVLVFGLVCVTIGFLTGPNRLKKTVPVFMVPAGTVMDGYVCFNYPLEEQNFLNELDTRVIERKPNQSEDYQKEKERRDVVAFSEYCKAGLLKNLNTGN
jgi:hypothetical protein